MDARIYRPTKTAMQSGRRNTRKWVLEYEPEQAKRLDPLMGWTGSGDMRGQVRLRFDTKESAIAYAESHGIAYTVDDPKPRRQKLKAYSDNFAYTRKEPWTH